jgi:hypothetical protein
MPDEDQLKLSMPAGEAAIIFPMRRSIVLLSLLLVACQVFSLAPTFQPAQSFSTPITLQTLVPLAGRTPAPVSSPTPPQSTETAAALQASQTGAVFLATENPLATGYPLATLAAAPQGKTFTVLFHPEGSLYVGDQVSIEVIAPSDAELKGRKVSLSMSRPAGVQNAEAQFEPYGLGGRLQATFQWSWDTSGLPAGEQNLTFTVQPDGPRWQEIVTLLPRGQLPPAETQASWATASSACCVLHYLTHSPAERDLSGLLTMMDEQADQVSRQMGLRLEDPVPVVLVPRLIGHGGFTGHEIVLSYLDRNYVGADLAVIFHHELVHYLDARLGGDLRPVMLVEGLAVYLSGGHYKPEPLLPRLAALLPPEAGCISAAQALAGGSAQAISSPLCGLNRYIPLQDLLNHFYFAQHEIGYLEAGSLVEFMVSTWGWTAFSGFYRDIHPLENPTAQPAGNDLSQSRALEAALQRHFGLTLPQLEDRFLQAVRKEPLRPQDVEDIRLTVRYYDNVRRYQLLMDPSAYFLNAWLPDGEQMRQRRIVADVLRNPIGAENMGLETLFVTANTYLRQGRYAQVQQLLDAIDVILNNIASTGAQALQ